MDKEKIKKLITELLRLGKDEAVNNGAVAVNFRVLIVIVVGLILCLFSIMLFIVIGG